MKEWILANLDWLVPTAATVLGALLSGSSVATIISLVRTIHLSQALNKARESKYYTICPKCKKKIYLDELVLRMPDGAVDNNLNGKADDLE